MERLRDGRELGMMAELPGGKERRASERYPFGGAEVYLYLRWRHELGTHPHERFSLRLKNLSCGGACGLTDAPLQVDDIVFLQFEETLMPAARVAWFRNTTIGLELVQAIPEGRMERLRTRHEAGQLWSPAMRERSDLPSWWTDLGEHERGRRGVLPES